MYVLCTEEILPADLLSQPSKRPEYVASFRSWAGHVNPDIGFWNSRWGTDFTWDSFAPAKASPAHWRQSSADLARWHAYIMRQILPPMIAAIREERPGAVIGFHDFLPPNRTRGLTAEDGALDPSQGFDFYAPEYYYNPKLQGGVEANLAALRQEVEDWRELYPGFPLFVGVAGYGREDKPTGRGPGGRGALGRVPVARHHLLAARAHRLQHLGLADGGARRD